MTDILRRSQAPVTDEAWKEIDLQASRILKGNLSGRGLVDFSGPHGWTLAAVNLGSVLAGTGEPIKGVSWGRREALNLIEIRAPFSLKIWELDNVSRGAKMPELNTLISAARKVALFEEGALYNGFGEAGIKELSVESERISLVEDTNGDGKADKASVYADNFRSPMDGIASGVLATARYVGMIFGVGISGAVFTTMLERGTSAALFSGVRIGLTISALACFAGVAACSTPDLPPRGRQQTAGK